MAPEPGFTPAVRAAVRVGRLVVRPLANWRFDLHVEGRHRMPPGPMVLAGNHFSHLDPPLGYLAVNRPVRYMAVDEIYGMMPAFDRLLEFYGTIPMSRVRAPLGALQVAVRHLDAGGVVGLFPEGKRVAKWGDAVPKRGAAWLSLLSGAPLMPLATTGTDQAFGLEATRVRRAPVRMRFGEPIWPDDHLDHVDPIGAMMEAWGHQIGRLVAPDYRYAVP